VRGADHGRDSTQVFVEVPADPYRHGILGQLDVIRLDTTLEVVPEKIHTILDNRE
jgi:hypothetical protein